MSKCDTENIFLNPNHPLLEDFQRILKEHLLAQIEKAKAEIVEIETETSEKRAELDRVGVKCYESQLVNDKQQKRIQEVVISLNTYSEKIEKEAKELEENTGILKQLEQKLFDTEKVNRELIHEIESAKLLSDQLSKYETKMDGNINLNKSIAHNLRKTDTKLQQDKKKQDYLIHNLVTEIWQLEDEKETYDQILQIKGEELEDLETKTAHLETSIQALETEHSALTASWQTVCVDIGHRNAKLECLAEQLQKLKFNEKTLHGEMRNVELEIKKEFSVNRQLNMKQQNSENDDKLIKQEMHKILERKRITEKEILDFQRLIEEMKRDIQNAKIETHRMEYLTENKNHVLHKIMAKKNSIEEEIVKTLEHTPVFEQTTKRYKEQWAQIKSKREDMKIKYEGLNNKVTRDLAEMNHQKNLNVELEIHRKEVDHVVLDLEKERESIKHEISTLNLKYSLNIEQYRNLSLRVSNAMSSEKETKVRLSWLKIIDLERFIETIRANVKDLQENWLREQKNLLTISTERQKQINLLKMLKKQALLQEQKNYSLNSYMEALQKQESETERKINNLHNIVLKMSENCCKQRSKKNDLNESTSFIQVSFELGLREAEIDLLDLEAKITDLEEEKVVLSKELVDTNREGLEWEKLMIMATEVLRENKDMQKESDEQLLKINKLRSIYARLKKEQAKILKDLTMCLVSRDHIYSHMDSKEKVNKSKNKPSELKTNHVVRLTDKRNKIKRVKKELKSFIQQKCSKENEIEKIKNQIKDHQKVIELKKVYNKKGALKELEEVKISRQLKYDLLIVYQRRSLMFQQIVMDRKPYTIFKNDNELEDRYSQEIITNKKLTEVVTKLKKRFPNRTGELTILANSLGVIMVAINNNLNMGFAAKK